MKKKIEARVLSREEKVIRNILLRLAEAGGADGAAGYDAGWDAGIDTAIEIVEEETGIRYEDIPEDRRLTYKKYEI